jgi:N-acetylneuraminic acid mutarotase
MPTPRSAIAAGVYNNHIVVPGGEMQNWQFLAAFKAVEAYNTTTNTWQILPSMPHQRHGLAVGVVGNRLYAVSGTAQSAGNGIADPDVNYNEALKLDEVLK